MEGEQQQGAERPNLQPDDPNKDETSPKPQSSPQAPLTEENKREAANKINNSEEDGKKSTRAGGDQEDSSESQKQKESESGKQSNKSDDEAHGDHREELTKSQSTEGTASGEDGGGDHRDSSRASSQPRVEASKEIHGDKEELEKTEDDSVGSKPHGGESADPPPNQTEEDTEEKQAATSSQISADPERDELKDKKNIREEEEDTEAKQAATSSQISADPEGEKLKGKKDIREDRLQEKTIRETEESPARQRRVREDIGPITADASEPDGRRAAAAPAGDKILWTLGVVVVVFVAVLAQNLFSQKPPAPQKGPSPVEVFRKQMEKVKVEFPNQREELWSRSGVHLERHLHTARPTEPVSLILTAGPGGERTLRCLARTVASAFSAARNGSVLHINGAGKAGRDSDQVKLDIDRELRGAFEGDTPVAVIHRLEELPPGATLIFYRYCDHENAAYKRSFLMFTVLLGEEIPPSARLSAVEEMVDDHLRRKFLSRRMPASFDQMDLDKYGGLWSRISHLILPVAAVERIERSGC